MAMDEEPDIRAVYSNERDAINKLLRGASQNYGLRRTGQRAKGLLSAANDAGFRIADVHQPGETLASRILEQYEPRVAFLSAHAKRIGELLHGLAYRGLLDDADTLLEGAQGKFSREGLLPQYVPFYDEMRRRGKLERVACDDLNPTILDIQRDAINTLMHIGFKHCNVPGEEEYAQKALKAAHEYTLETDEPREARFLNTITASLDRGTPFIVQVMGVGHYTKDVITAPLRNRGVPYCLLTGSEL